MFSLFRNPLAFPAGFAAGFDPAHRAAYNCRFSGIASNSNFTSLLSGANGTLTASPTFAIDSIIGPSLVFNGTASQASALSGQPTVVAPWVILAAIFTISSTSTNIAIISTSTANTGDSLQVRSGVLFGVVTGSSAISSGLTLTLNTPYFAVAVIGNNVGNAPLFLLKNLITGKVTTATGSTAAGARTPNNGSVWIGNYTTGIPFRGGIAATMWSDTAMGFAEMLAWADDPWVFWYPEASEYPLTYEIGGLSPITGTLSITEANDTLAATASSIITATLSATEADDVLSASGVLPITAALAVTEGNDVLVAAGTVVITGDLFITETDDNLASTGFSNIIGNLSVVEADDILLASGDDIIVGSLIATETDDTLIATAYSNILASLLVVENSDVLVATGIVSGGIICNLAVTEDADTLIAGGYVYNTPPTPGERIHYPGSEWQFWDRVLDRRRVLP